MPDQCSRGTNQTRPVTRPRRAPRRADAPRAASASAATPGAARNHQPVPGNARSSARPAAAARANAAGAGSRPGRSSHRVRADARAGRRRGDPVPPGGPRVAGLDRARTLLRSTCDHAAAWPPALSTGRAGPVRAHRWPSVRGLTSPTATTVLEGWTATWQPSHRTGPVRAAGHLLFRHKVAGRRVVRGLPPGRVNQSSPGVSPGVSRRPWPFVQARPPHGPGAFPVIKEFSAIKTALRPRAHGDRDSRPV